MGANCPPPSLGEFTYTQRRAELLQIQAYRDDMEPFRRAMRAQYRPAFDQLWDHAYYRAPSGKMAERGDPERVILFSMLVGLQQEILELREQLMDPEDQR